MRCIFCKKDSSNSKSVEHIIPESLGNTEHILPPGIVCDKCNNYFASNIEKHLLESRYFLYARFENLIVSKKNRVPSVKGFHLKSQSIIDFTVTQKGLHVFVNKNDIPRFINTTSEGGRLYLPHPTQPDDNYTLSRFIGKVAIEVIAFRILEIPNALEVDLIDHSGLDLLRNFVRYGNKNINWPIHRRELYPADALFYSEEDKSYYDIPHEFALLYTEKKELFIVLAIFGIEYVMNLGGPELEGYSEWLKKHDNKSPLYLDGIDYQSSRGVLPFLQNGSIIHVFSND